MPRTHFWRSVQELAASFSGDQDRFDNTIKTEVQACFDIPALQRAELKRQILQIIGGLAQVHSRLQQLDGL